jgi:hypothetical protein
MPLPSDPKASQGDPKAPLPIEEEKKPLVEVVRDEKPKGLHITWKDGLPDDPFERMQIETGLIAAGLTSKYSSIKRRLDGDDEATEAEMQRIEEEQKASQMAEAAMGVGMPPPSDQMEAQETREQMKTEREEEKKLERELARKKAAPPKK